MEYSVEFSELKSYSDSRMVLEPYLGVLNSFYLLI